MASCRTCGPEAGASQDWFYHLAPRSSWPHWGIGEIDLKPSWPLLSTISKGIDCGIGGDLPGVWRRPGGGGQGHQHHQC